MSALAQRQADLALRAGGGFVRLRVWWPPDAADGCPVALFLVQGAADLEAAHALCLEGGCVVLALETAAPDVATIALEWAGEHARYIGADPERLLVAGGGLAATAALHARDEGWPPLTRQVLIGPSEWPPPSVPLAGAAPATVVGAPDYAARLRAAGVEVEEPADGGWMRDLIP